MLILKELATRDQRPVFSAEEERGPFRRENSAGDGKQGSRARAVSEIGGVNAGDGGRRVTNKHITNRYSMSIGIYLLSIRRENG